jgi:hypothetical protein
MKCELENRDQMIDDFLLEKLSEQEADAFEVHAFGCRECLDELRVREQMIRLIKEERATLLAKNAETKSNTLTGVLKMPLGNIFPQWQNAWIYAGAAAVVLVIAFIAGQRLLKEDTANKYAAKYQESPYFESLMQQAYRSRSISVSIASPQVGENLKGDIVFRWDIKIDGQQFDGPLGLKIMNNKENLVHSAAIEGTQYHLKEELAPGLYYWTIEHQGEMLYLGKFFVNKSHQ